MTDCTSILTFYANEHIVAKEARAYKPPSHIMVGPATQCRPTYLYWFQRKEKQIALIFSVCIQDLDPIYRQDLNLGSA